MTRRVRVLSAAARPEAAARRRLSVVLSDADVDDSRRLDLDGTLPRETHHPARADAGHGGGRDRRRTPGPSRERGNRRRVRLADRRVQPDGGRACREPPAAGALVGRARTQASRRRGTAPVCRDGARSSRDRCGVDRRSRQHPHLERRRVASARHGCARRRAPGLGGVRHPRARAAGHRSSTKRRAIATTCARRTSRSRSKGARSISRS